MSAETWPPEPGWLERASDLLAEPDPGPTPYLVEEQFVDQAICAVVGRWKTTKSYYLLDIAISIVTGRPFLDSYAIPQPGPVVFVIEESGRRALWRRLDSLCRGRAIDRDELGDLHVAPNKRVRLDDPGWQAELLSVGRELGPRAFVFDPLARMKAPGRDENAQKEYAPIIEFLRDLRDQTAAAVVFVQHTGHNGETMRGTSDLESVWESRLNFKRDETGTVTVESEHREAEAGQPINYRLAWDETTRTIRLRAVVPEDLARVIAHLAEHPTASANDVAKALTGIRRGEALKLYKQARTKLPQSGSVPPGTTPPVPPIPHPPFPEGRGAVGTSSVPPPVKADDDLPF